MSVELIIKWVHAAMLLFVFCHFIWLLASIFRNAYWCVRLDIAYGNWIAVVGHLFGLGFLLILPTFALVSLLDWVLR